MQIQGGSQGFGAKVLGTWIRSARGQMRLLGARRHRWCRMAYASKCCSAAVGGPKRRSRLFMYASKVFLVVPSRITASLREMMKHFVRPRISLTMTGGL